MKSIDNAKAILEDLKGEFDNAVVHKDYSEVISYLIDALSIIREINKPKAEGKG